MWFGELPSEQCHGGILAHSVRTKTRRIPKGTVLDVAIIQELIDGGYNQLTIARPGVDDVNENDAAMKLAKGGCVAGVNYDKAHTGRVNVFASVDGLLTYDREAIVLANSVSSDITLSVLPENQWVLSGRMVASAKIIPYAVASTELDAACASIDSARLAVHEPRRCTAVLIQTCLPSIKTSVLDKTRKVTEQRLAARSSDLGEEIRCQHTVEDLTEAIGKALALKPELILIVGASAISDRGDVLPVAVSCAGGEIRRVGLPVDPGNLLMLADVESVPVLGLPGCARSPKYNGFDLLLDRIVCAIPITDQWLNSLAVGGLLGEVHDRPQPRIHPRVSVENSCRVAALILAAGSSKRAGTANKLLHTFNNKPMICSTIESVLGSSVDGSLVVTGYQQQLLQEAIEPYGIETCYCPTHSSGMAHTIALGISRLQSYDAVIVCLGDMPHVKSAVIDKLLEAADDAVIDKIIVPVHNGVRGNPVVIGKAFFDSLIQHDGDTGARHLIRQYPDKVVEVQVDTDAVLIDHDTQESLQQLDNI